MRARTLPILFVQACLVLCLCMVVSFTGDASAITALPTPLPISGSYGLEATKKKAPPTQGATITVPGNGASFTTSPTTVSGVCPNDLLVQIYDNGVMIGSVVCKGGSFSIQVTLFSGANELSASVFDELDQTGPESNKVVVTYTNASFSAFGAIMTLSSVYGRRAANPNATLTWPLLLAGGNGPYAFSVDWGDGGTPELKSLGIAGQININHVYKKAGVYTVTVKVVDANGVSAFLQLTAIANGVVAIGDTSAPTVKTTVIKQILWIPLVVAFALLFPTYWLGRRSELVSLHKRLQKNVDNYKEL